jgi:hypothetical protein
VTRGAGAGRPIAVSLLAVPLTISSPPPMHQPYSLRAVARSGGVWCRGVVVSVLVLVPGCASRLPRSHRMHPRSNPRAVARGRGAGAGSSCPGEGGGGRVVSVTWRVYESGGTYLVGLPAVPLVYPCPCPLCWPWVVPVVCRCSTVHPASRGSQRWGVGGWAWRAWFRGFVLAGRWW